MYLRYVSPARMSPAQACSMAVNPKISEPTMAFGIGNVL